MRTGLSREYGIVVATLVAFLMTAGCGKSTTTGNGPSITTQPSTQTVTEGNSATFSVTATGSGTLEYQWYKDGIALLDATEAFLKVIPVSISHVGSYVVVVSNAYGSATSDTAVLTVNDRTSSDGWNLTTGAYFDDLVENTSFDYSVAIKLDTLDVTVSPNLAVSGDASARTVTLGGTPVMTITADAYGLTINSTTTPDGVNVKLALSSNSIYSGSITLFSVKALQLALDGVTIASPDGPAINIQSKKRTFVVLKDGTSNVLSDSPKWSNRYLPNKTLMDLKATFFSEGSLVFSGGGSLSINGSTKHALCSDAHVRLREGTLKIVANANKKDGIHANDAFIMDGGTLSIETTEGAGKGIKVEGKEDTSTPLGFIAINAGTLTIESYDKAITASWKAKDDGKTVTLDDDPDPLVTINGGTLTITTFGTSTKDLLSPEGIESKSVLTINGGTLTITTTDDGLNAGTRIAINGGKIYVKSSTNDAVDSNGMMTIAGGVLVAEGAGGAAGGLDCNQNTFLVTGGTFVGIGGENSAVTASASTQYSVAIGGGTSTASNFPANTLLVVEDSSGKVVFAYLVTEPRQAILTSASGYGAGNYTLYKGGTLGPDTKDFHNLYLDLSAATYSDGTKVQGFTISSPYTAL